MGNPVLRKVAQPVKNLSASHIKQLIADLKAIGLSTDGVGLSAPQIHQSYRIFILSPRATPRYPHSPTLPPTIIINTEIISVSQEKFKDWEGCLSIRNIRALIPRHKKIVVKYTTEKGEIVQNEYTDFVAKVFQHEFDHLDGLVFLDRVENTLDIATSEESLRIIASKKTTIK